MKESGEIEWNCMERFWSQLLYQYLCLRPEDHNFLMSEPVFNTMKNKSITTEVFFEVGIVGYRSYGVEVFVGFELFNSQRKITSST